MDRADGGFTMSTLGCTATEDVEKVGIYYDGLHVAEGVWKRGKFDTSVLNRVCAAGCAVGDVVVDEIAFVVQGRGWVDFATANGQNGPDW